MHINTICDTSLGDLDSPLWSQHGFDSVRDGLLTYYQHHKEAIIETKTLPDPRSAVPYQSFPNNCFTMATGMIGKGTESFGPHCFQFVDITKATNQYKEVGYKVFSDANNLCTINQQEFATHMAANGFPLLSRNNAALLETHQPVIGMLYEARDYHFVKPTVIFHDNKPVVLMSQKAHKRGGIFFNKSLPEFFQDYSDRMSLYKNAEIYLSDKKLIGRQVMVDTNDSSRAKIMLTACKL